MSRSSSKSQSGLGTVRRNFSSSGISQLPKSSQEIHWSPSPPVPPPCPVKKLSGSEARLKAIQEALAGYPASSPPVLAQSSSQNKRPSPTGSSATANPPTKRARQLPPDWPGADSLSKPSLSSKPLSSSNRDTGKSTFRAPASSSSSLATKSKLASVFLSQEQTQILKLVQDGESVFYTGSAGKSFHLLWVFYRLVTCNFMKVLENPSFCERSSRRCAGSMSKHQMPWPSLHLLVFVNPPVMRWSIAQRIQTGIAACNIGGVTIHSFAGIGLGIEPAEDLVKRIKRNKKSATRWLRTKVLIIDEGPLQSTLVSELYYISYL